jgi:hypothetical protein
MKIKTSELKDLALDWAVVRANYEINFEEVWRNFRNECGYSCDWAQGGPIIEREGISVWVFDDVTWKAENPFFPCGVDQVFEGPTPLIAAMRCYVASRLGDEVEVPDSIGGAA